MSHLLRSIEVQGGRAHPDEVPRRAGHRAVHPEHRELDLLARPDVPADHYSVGSVEALDHRPAGLAQHERQRPVHPHLGVVVDDDLEDGGGSRGIEPTDPLRDRDLDPVPVEGEPARRLAHVELRRGQRLPARVVETGGAGVGRDVVGPVRRPGGPEVGARAPVLDVDDLHIAVPPLPLDEASARFSRKIDDRFGPTRGRVQGHLR